jgi:zinc transport system substrate-binding protein
VRRVAILTVAVGMVLAVLAGAGARSGATGRERAEVVASFFPLAEAASRVGGRHVHVTNLTPPGVEPHDLEATTKDIDTIEDADLVVVMGDGFQPALEQAADRRDGATLVVLDVLRGSLRPNDPHVWLDPRRMIEIVDRVAAQLSDIDAKHRNDYRTRAETYSDELRALDSEYRDGLADCDRRLVVTSHDAFGYLADAYDLRVEGVSGIEPDAEPNPRRLGELADLVREQGVTTIFTEELVSEKVARTLAREAGGIRVATLDPLEGLSKARQASGADYLSVMRTNLARLQRALGCH